MDDYLHSSSFESDPRTGVLTYLYVKRIHEGNNLPPADIGRRRLAEQALKGTSVSRPHEPQGITDHAARRTRLR